MVLIKGDDLAMHAQWWHGIVEVKVERVHVLGDICAVKLIKLEQCIDRASKKEVLQISASLRNFRCVDLTIFRKVFDIKLETNSL